MQMGGELRSGHLQHHDGPCTQSRIFSIHAGCMPLPCHCHVSAAQMHCMHVMRSSQDRTPGCQDRPELWMQMGGDWGPGQLRHRD